MKAHWKNLSLKERYARLGALNEEARRQDLATMTHEQATEILEGLLSYPMCPPHPSLTEDHPLSLSHRLRRDHV